MNTIKKISSEEYFAAEGLSNSYLINFDKSPRLAEMGIKPTKAMDDGSAVHAFVLEDKLTTGYSVTLLNDLKQNVRGYKLYEETTVGSIIDSAQKETSFFWDEIINGEIVQRKARIDILFETPNNVLIVDLKKTRDVFDFYYSIKKYKYYRQAATYIDGVTTLLEKPVTFIFLAFEFDNPENIRAFQISENDILYGQVANTKSIINWLEWCKNPVLELSGIEKINIF